MPRFRTHMQEQLGHIIWVFEVHGEGFATMQRAFKITQWNSPAIPQLRIDIINRRVPLDTPKADR